jgi:hypothetical protein
MALFISVTEIGISRAVLVKLDQLHTDDGCTIKLWSEHYKEDFAKENDEHFNAIVQQLISSDKKLKGNQYVLVEPLQVYEILCNLPVKDLITKLKESSLKNTTVENIEIRTVAAGAAFILTPNIQPGTSFAQLQFYVGGKSYELEKITWSDLHQEYEFYATSFQSMLVNLDEEKSKVIGEKISETQKEYQKLGQLIKEYEPEKESKSKTILKYSKKLFKQNKQDERSALRKSIMDTFGHLLELYTIKRILTILSENKQSDIQVFSRFLHIIEDKKLLCKLGFKLNHSIGSDSCDVPLSNNQIVDGHSIWCSLI